MTLTGKLPEVWLRGPLPDVPGLLQPVAHALLQARDEVNELMADFPSGLLWQGVAGMASPAFHVQHITGVLDRLFTYAEGKTLSNEQLVYLDKEGRHDDHTDLPLTVILEEFNQQVDVSLEKLKHFDEEKLTEIRTVGRKQLPSTVIGLLVHSAEHTMRHTGQLLVTVNALKQR